MPVFIVLKYLLLFIQIHIPDTIKNIENQIFLCNFYQTFYYCKFSNETHFHITYSETCRFYELIIMIIIVNT